MTDSHTIDLAQIGLSEENAVAALALEFDMILLMPRPDMDDAIVYVPMNTGQRTYESLDAQLAKHRIIPAHRKLIRTLFHAEKMAISGEIIDRAKPGRIYRLQGEKPCTAKS